MRAKNKPQTRILQVSTRDLGGGAEGSAWNLFSAYRQRGLDSWLAVGHKFSGDPDVFIIPNESQRPAWTRFWRLIQMQGTNRRYRKISQLLGKLAWFGEPMRKIEHFLGIEDFDYPGTRRLLDLTPQKPTVVHCHNLHGNYFDLRVLPQLSRQVPTIINLRDAWPLAGHCAHSLLCDRWKSGCGKCPDLSIYPAIHRDGTAYNWRRKQDIYARSHLYVTAPSKWLIDCAKKSMLNGIEYRVIPNAIDLTMFQPGDRAVARAALNLPPTSRIILLIAHNMFKDLVTMEAALSKVKKLTAKEELLFLCLGRNGTEHPLGQGTIRYLGVERDTTRMARYYQAADVYIHASLGEAFGKTIAEAMACGTPVVATAVDGIPELILHERTGFLVPRSDAERMANAVSQLLANKEVQGRIGHAAAAFARQNFDLARQVNSFIDYYDDVTEDWLQWSADAMSNS